MALTVKFVRAKPNPVFSFSSELFIYDLQLGYGSRGAGLHSVSPCGLSWAYRKSGFEAEAQGHCKACNLTCTGPYARSWGYIEPERDQWEKLQKFLEDLTSHTNPLTAALLVSDFISVAKSLTLGPAGESYAVRWWGPRSDEEWTSYLTESLSQVRLI